MTTQHTPGDWEAKISQCGTHEDDFVVEIRAAHGSFTKVVKWVGFDGLDMSPAEVRANARLIAAAPKLLTALRRLSLAALCRDSTMGDPCRLIEVKAELMAASRYADEVIAQATRAAP